MSKCCISTIIKYKFFMYKIFSLIYLFFISLSFANAEVVNVFEFTNSELSKLEVRKVRGISSRIWISESTKRRWIKCWRKIRGKGSRIWIGEPTKRRWIRYIDISTPISSNYINRQG